MANPFDAIQPVIFNTVTDVMGYEAEWTPRAGGAKVTGKVLFKTPTEKERVFAVDYNPDKITAEWKVGDFPGLYESARSGAQSETLVLIDKGEFFILSAMKKSDGNYYEATLKEK